MTPLQKKLAGIKLPAQGSSTPLWKGPEREGISFSLLSRFLSCRERFRLHVIEGLQSNQTWNHRLGFGNMWHVCEECHALGRDFKTGLQVYVQKECQLYPTQRTEIDKWYNVCKVQFPVYVDYWSKQPDMLARKALVAEEVFCVDYPLPSGRIVKLKGKWDSVDFIRARNSGFVWLMENKTKGQINQLQLQRQLTFDLQTMIYLVALTEDSKDGSHWDMLGDKLGQVIGPEHVVGVRYNVIRRPLSGGKGSIVQHKPSKSNPQGETREAYFARLRDDYIAAEPGEFFMRWDVKVSANEIKVFKDTCLNPILENLCYWYDEQMGKTLGDVGPPAHWRHPFGVFNILDEGGSSDVDEYLYSGSKAGLCHVTNLFPELTLAS